MKFAIQKLHDGKVTTITIYLEAESLTKYILKALGLNIEFKKSIITIQVTNF